MNPFRHSLQAGEEEQQGFICILFVFNRTILEDFGRVPFAADWKRSLGTAPFASVGFIFGKMSYGKNDVDLEECRVGKKNSNLTKLNYTFTKQCRVEKKINNVVWRKNCRFFFVFGWWPIKGLSGVRLDRWPVPKIPITCGLNP